MTEQEKEARDEAYKKNADRARKAEAAKKAKETKAKKAEEAKRETKRIRAMDLINNPENEWKKC